MTPHQVDPLRALTDEEREVSTHISRSGSEPASHVAWAKALPAVADGKSYTEAAPARRSEQSAMGHLDCRLDPVSDPPCRAGGATAAAGFGQPGRASDTGFRAVVV